jgi:DNA replication protein DnaC
MPKIEGADLTEVSTAFELPPEGEHLVLIKDVEITKTASGLPQVRVKMSIDDSSSENNGKPITDFLVMQNNDGKRNDISLKQLKRYFEAALGDNYNFANYDTDDLKDSRVRIVVKHRSYEKDGETRSGMNVTRIFPA